MLLLAMASRVVSGWPQDSVAAERYAQRGSRSPPDAPAVVAARAYLRMWQGDKEEAEQLLEDRLAEPLTMGHPCLLHDERALVGPAGSRHFW